MAQFRSPLSIRVGSTSERGHKESNRWATIKPSLVQGLKVTQMALDGLPIPGAKGCVCLILHFIETADLASSNAEALESLQSRLEGLKEVLLPIYACKAVDNVPDDVRKDVENLAMCVIPFMEWDYEYVGQHMTHRNLDKLAEQWKPKLERTHKKRLFIHRLLNAKDDSETLNIFASAVEQAIQDFLIITTTNGRTAAFREDIKNRDARTLHLLPRAPTASYDSVRTGGANGCLKGTRVSILNNIREWATSTNPNQAPIFWLNGLAGIGKTTIAHTMALKLDAEGLLGASFIFLRADDQLKDARLVFPTLAFQLAHFSSHFRTGLVEVLELNPDYGSKQLEIQFQKLILQPFSAISLSAPIILILDALDECEPEKLTSELLRILLHNIRNVPFLRVFITSRPEGYIREALGQVDSSSPHQKLVLHEDIHAEEVEHDIRLFLKLRLQDVWNERTKQISVRWPSEGDLEKLVKQSGKLFVYAATAVRFIVGNRTFNLDRQLSTLLSVKIGHVPNGEPYRQLDGLYLQILGTILTDSSDEYYTQRFRRIVGTIVLLERPLPLVSLAKFLGDYSVAEILDTLYHLHSIVIVPVVDSEAPRTYHLSFPNFITNANRCTNPTPYINPSHQAKYLFDRCLAIMERSFGPVRAGSLDKKGNSSALQVQDATATEEVIPLEEDLSTDGDKHSAQTHASLEDDSEYFNLEAETRYSENYWCRHLMNIPSGNKEVAISLERFIFHSGCSHQFQAFLQETAKRLFAQLFPDAHLVYSFGKRLNPEGLTGAIRQPPTSGITGIPPQPVKSVPPLDKARIDFNHHYWPEPCNLPPKIPFAIDAKNFWPVVGARLGFMQSPASDTEPARLDPIIGLQIWNCSMTQIAPFDQSYIYVEHNRPTLQRYLQDQKLFSAQLKMISQSNQGNMPPAGPAPGFRPPGLVAPLFPQSGSDPPTMLSPQQQQQTLMHRQALQKQQQQQMQMPLGPQGQRAPLPHTDSQHAGQMPHQPNINPCYLKGAKSSAF
ncbi:hypothetical protein D9619_001411 [Psilocybe cf. subviscida]|uniref:NACHT domain-containing protein n=1 Tax=Psilocybe cf. subviscida TaxID=2480587 RepID=A0A8H5F2I7_9AGAR|nr:hypothetical protein D9619_001411 [Psilocybe cf. subviscida]